MALDAEAMLIFGALARAGGVRGAAATLGVPRSTISRRLAQLEEQVGSPLVVRTARRFALTEIGSALLPQCDRLEELLRESDDIARGASREPSGVLRVAMAPVIAEETLPAIISELAKKWPRLSIDARLGVEYVDLRKGGVDVAVRTGAVDDATDIFATRVGTSISGFWASPDYVKRHGEPEKPGDLASHECIIVGASHGSWRFQVGTREIRVDVQGRLRVDSFRLARSLAALGLGIVRTSRIFADPLVASGELVPLLERYWAKVPLFAVHAGPSPAPPKVRAFIDLARTVIGDRLSAFA